MTAAARASHAPHSKVPPPRSCRRSPRTSVRPSWASTSAATSRCPRRTSSAAVAKGLAGLASAGAALPRPRPGSQAALTPSQSVAFAGFGAFAAACQTWARHPSNWHRPVELGPDIRRL
eukprot:scaffold2755_cov64-Phaeocystis_antarctica.AAC.1